MKISKKAVLGTFTMFALVLAIVTFLIYSYSYGSEAEKRVIGTTQLDLLNYAVKGEIALQYIDESAKIAAAQAVSELAKHGGYYNGSVTEEYMGFTVWDYRTSQLPTDVEDNFSIYMNMYLDSYLERYTDLYIPKDNYDYWFSQGKLKGFANTDLSVSSSGIGIGTGIGSPSDADNKVIKAVDNEDLGNMARNYASLYDGLPYVWGGESPYTYEVSVNDQKTNPDSIFKGVSLEKYQPAGNSRSGQPTVPGFDCSGFFWWIFRHAGIIDQRLTAEGYYELAQADWQRVCYKEQCTKEFISDPFNVQQGDVLFIDPCPSGVCHIAIYAHDGQIVESTGSQGVVMRKIPESYYPDGSIGIEAIYRPDLGKVGAINTPQKTQAYDIPSQPQEISYSVRPSFTIDLDSIQDNYKKLREDGYRLFSALDNCQPGKDCVRQKLGELSLDWSLDCGGEDLAYYDLVEQLDLCNRSADNGCLCNIDLGKKQGYTENDYEIGLEKKGSGTMFIYGKNRFIVNTTLLAATSFRKGEEHVAVNPLPLDSKKVLIQLEYGSNGLNNAIVKLPGTLATLYFSSGIKLGNAAKVYKSPSGLAFIDSDDYNDDGNDYRTLPACTLPSARTYRFCVPSDKKMLVYGNEQLEYRNIIYRFAIRK